ncbi:cuticle protein 18.6 [Lepeophtheirus salmonis]|uniref:cuticle protein 18.6 n=1 Tax=Lepeophtheirus salmonis TaxID=72036 RepID=UPI001AEB5EED|nr:cuticle protein 7-like [Lepeophtheirus salmonis]
MYTSVFLLSVVFSCAFGAPQYPASQPAYTPVEEPQPYAYQYAVQDPQSGNDFSAEESSDGQVISGSYQVALPDGRIQTVTYTVSGDSGYVADVQYEGTPSYPEAPQQPRYV